MDPRKTIKVLAILSLVFGILGVIVGALTIVGGGAATAVSSNQEIMSQLSDDEEMQANLNQLNDAAGTDLSTQEAVAGTGVLIIVLGVIAIIASIFGILQGVFGLKAANGQGANGAFVIGIISLVLRVIGVVGSLGSGSSGLAGSAIGIVIAGLYVYCAKQIKDEEAGTL